MEFKVLISPRALEELEEALEYYSEIPTALKAFSLAFDNSLSTLSTNPYFEVRYKNVRALPIEKFPYLIFFTVDEAIKLVHIRSVFNTYQNPVKYP